MTVDDDPLVVVWKSERFNLECGGTLLLKLADLDKSCDATIVTIRVKKKISGTIERIAEIAKEQSSPSTKRDNCNHLLHKTIVWLKLIQSLNLFKLNSELLNHLDSLVKAHVKFLNDAVYKISLDDCLLDNEFLLMQNDLAQLLHLADSVPAIAPAVGRYFGELYLEKRRLYLKWFFLREQQLTNRHIPLMELASDLDDMRSRVFACWNCYRHYMQCFSIDKRMQLPVKLCKNDFENFLAPEGFINVDVVKGYAVYITKNLVDNKQLLELFLETRCNQLKYFGKDFIIVVPENCFENMDHEFDIKTSKLPFLTENAWFRGDLSAFNPNELLLSGRSSKELQIFIRKISAAGFNMLDIVTRTPNALTFPFPFYDIMAELRINGMTAVNILQKLCIQAIDIASHNTNSALSSESFAFFNHFLLYTLQFASVALKASIKMQDIHYRELISLFLESSTMWIEWLTGLQNSLISPRIVCRWAVSAFDNLLPSMVIVESAVEDFVAVEQIKRLTSALEILDLKKKKIMNSSETMTNLEHISMFKLKRIKITFLNFINKRKGLDMENQTCQPLSTKFLGAFDEFASTPLEKALTPMHYQLIAKIYSGPNACLHQCLDLNTGNFVAAKQFFTSSKKLGQSIDLDLDSSSSSLDSMDQQISLKDAIKETEILKAVQGHPYICQYLSSAYEYPNFFLFTEFYQGGNLAENKLVSKRDPTKPESKSIWHARFKICKQVNEALVHIHELGVVHGDLKPANILIDDLGNMRLADFGSSEFVVQTPRQYPPLCMESRPKSLQNFTIPYMAPELLTGCRPNWSSDMWSIGCLVLELSTGRPPWYGLNGNEILINLSEGKTPLNHAEMLFIRVPQHFTRLIKMCLVEDPNMRPSARELLEFLY